MTRPVLFLAAFLSICLGTELFAQRSLSRDRTSEEQRQTEAAEKGPAHRDPLTPGDTMVRLKLVLAHIEADPDVDLAAELNGPSAEVARRLTDLVGRNYLRISEQVLVTTLENNPCFVQSGQRTPIRTASTLTRTGRANSYRTENTGLVVAFTPRVDGDKVICELDVERSRLGAKPAQQDDDKPLAIETLTYQAVLATKNGHSVAVAGIESSPGERWVVIVSVSTSSLAEESTP